MQAAGARFFRTLPAAGLTKLAVLSPRETGFALSGLISGPILHNHIPARELWFVLAPGQLAWAQTNLPPEAQRAKKTESASSVSSNEGVCLRSRSPRSGFSVFRRFVRTARFCTICISAGNLLTTKARGRLALLLNSPFESTERAAHPRPARDRRRQFYI
jgi:hypothetical protein